MSHWFWEFLEHGSPKHAGSRNLAHTQPSPTKTNTVGKMGRQVLKMFTTGKSRAAADKSQSRETGQLFNRVLGALCCFTANTGTKPKVNTHPAEWEKLVWMDLVYIRMKPLIEHDWVRQDFLCLRSVSVCVCVHVWFHQSVSVCTLVYWTMSSGVLCEEDCTWAKGAGVQTWVKEPAQSPINHSMLHPSLTAYWARTDRGDMSSKSTPEPLHPSFCPVSSQKKKKEAGHCLKNSQNNRHFMWFPLCVLSSALSACHKCNLGGNCTIKP